MIFFLMTHVPSANFADITGDLSNTFKYKMF